MQGYAIIILLIKLMILYTISKLLDGIHSQTIAVTACNENNGISQESQYLCFKSKSKVFCSFCCNNLM